MESKETQEKVKTYKKYYKENDVRPFLKSCSSTLYQVVSTSGKQKQYPKLFEDESSALDFLVLNNMRNYKIIQIKTVISIMSTDIKEKS